MTERTARQRWWDVFLALVVGLTIAIVGPLVLSRATPWVEEQLRTPGCDDPRGLVPLPGVTVEVANPSLPGYEPASLVDTDTATAWIEGIAGDDPRTNLGQGTTFEFDLPDGSDLQMICIVNGYAASWDLFRANASVRLLTVSTDAGENVVSGLSARREADYAAFETLDFARGRTDRVTVRIDSARAGLDDGQAESSTDLAVSELEFWVRP